MTEPKSEDPVLQELKKITKLLTLANATTLETEIAKVANSDARKKIWVLMDGQRTTSELVKATGMTLQGVLNFIYASQTADLVEYTQRQPPRRKISYVPPAWIGLVELLKAEEPVKTEEQLIIKEKKSEGEESGPSTV